MDQIELGGITIGHSSAEREHGPGVAAGRREGAAVSSMVYSALRTEVCHSLNQRSEVFLSLSPSANFLHHSHVRYCW